jgi:hypothetical protein
MDILLFILFSKCTTVSGLLTPFVPTIKINNNKIQFYEALVKIKNKIYTNR